MPADLQVTEYGTIRARAAVGAREQVDEDGRDRLQLGNPCLDLREMPRCKPPDVTRRTSVVPPPGQLEHLAWRDAFLNAAMLLGGMGPIDAPRTDGGKLFLGCYALYAGLVVSIAAGLILTPVLHRVLHRFHWERGRR